MAHSHLLLLAHYSTSAPWLLRIYRAPYGSGTTGTAPTKVVRGPGGSGRRTGKKAQWRGARSWSTGGVSAQHRVAVLPPAGPQFAPWHSKAHQDTMPQRNKAWLSPCLHLDAMIEAVKWRCQHYPPLRLAGEGTFSIELQGTGQTTAWKTKAAHHEVWAGLEPVPRGGRAEPVSPDKQNAHLQRGAGPAL